MTVFEMIADERRQLADLLSTLTLQQLETPSLIPTWTVKDVAGHLTLGLRPSIFKFLWAALSAGSIEKGTDKLTWEAGRRPVAELVALFRSRADSRFAPPGIGPQGPLAELLVHGLDIRVPLGIKREIPADRATTTLDFLFGGSARGVARKQWREGLRFEATDVQFSRGEGPLVRGRSDSLMLAVSGRKEGLDGLEGDGVGMLRQRL